MATDAIDNINIYHYSSDSRAVIRYIERRASSPGSRKNHVTFFVLPSLAVATWTFLQDRYSYTSAFQLTLDLANVAPAKNLVGWGSNAILNFARDLRKTGSKLLVEDDFTAVFGRARVDDTMRAIFKKNVLREGFIQDMHPGGS
ncbi:hypothetical protein PG991_012421 [Apiospora marii]|uniref:Uncharacterized protein n=1 Tax=Apiospora marii TaxID=335849 RepID=A0ABR1R9N5_9PEZI